MFCKISNKTSIIMLLRKETTNKPLKSTNEILRYIWSEEKCAQDITDTNIESRLKKGNLDI